MRVLITGGSGYIGSKLVKKLQENYNHEVYSIDMTPLPIESGDSTEHIIADLTNYEGLEEKLEDVDVDVVVHLAAMVRGDAPEVMKTNVMGTTNILEILRNKDPKLVISASTAGQLYRNAQYTPIDERHPITPVTPYGISKQLAENVINYYHRTYDLPTLIFRQTNVYGPSPNQSSTVINKFIEKAMEDGELTIYGEGTQVRNFIHIGDLVNFYLRAINSKKLNVLAGETINLGGPEEYQIKEIAEKVSEAIREKGKEVEISSAPSELPPEHEIYLFRLSIEKARGLLDYYPEISVSEGIKRILTDMEK